MQAYVCTRILAYTRTRILTYKHVHTLTDVHTLTLAHTYTCKLLAHEFIHSYAGLKYSLIEEWSFQALCVRKIKML